MKKEIISFAIGAGIVGCIWVGTAFIKCESKPVTTEPVQKNIAEQPNLGKKPLIDVYSAMPDKNFPGLKVYDTDFLIPWNRTVITEYAVFDDPKADYGNANAPMSAFIFRITEKGNSHYFMTAGRQGFKISNLVYLGENIKIEKDEGAGNGYWMATYKDSKGRIGRGVVPISFITGSEPDEAPGVAQDIQLDSLLKYAEKCDPFVWEINARQLWTLLQQSLRKNDKMTIAKMITFPMEFKEERIYTRAEFVERFDEIFYPEYKEFVLKSDAAEIWFSGRGAMMPDRCSWLSDKCISETDKAGPLLLRPDLWLKLGLKKVYGK